MTNEIELYSKIQDPIQAALQMGQVFAKSGMFGCQKTEEGTVIALACLAERKSPFEIKRTYHLIEGNLSMRADAMLAHFRGRGGRHKVVEQSPDKAAIELSTGDDKQVFQLTWKEVQQEPFVYKGDGKSPKKNWATPRARMQTLWARVVSHGVRTMMPEVVTGIYTPEEIEDFTPAAEPKSIFVADPTTSAPEAPQPKPRKTAPKSEDKPANVIDIAAEPVATTPAPEPPQPPEPAQPKPFVPAIDSVTGKITDETCLKLEAEFGTHAPKALKWLEEKKWIRPMGDLKDLTLARAKMILAEPAKFLKHIGAIAA